jgi:hypothetical protein
VKDDLQEFPKTNSSQWPMSNSTLGVVVFGPLKDKENIEYIKGVIRIRKPKKDRQYNGQAKNNKRKNNDLQNITNLGSRKG